MEYGQIFHVTHIGKYYCKNMKYRINIAYYMSKSGIGLVISRVASYIHEPEASANTAYEWNNIAIFHNECNKWFILFLIFF